jgi:hypothetical protein
LAAKFGQAALKLNVAQKPTTTQQWAMIIERANLRAANFDLARVERAGPASIW